MSAAAAAAWRRPWPRAGEALLAAGAVAALVALSLALRTGAMGEGLWIDEGLSAGIAGHPLGEIPGLLRRDGSPALHYVLLHAWMQALGDGEAALRSLSLVAALAAIPAALWAGWSLFGRRAGALAAALAAVNPFLTAYAQEARMYALVGLLSLLAAAAFLHAFAGGRRAYALSFGGLLAALLHTHNWGLFLAAGSLAALAVLAPAAPDRRRLAANAALAYGAAALLYAPWLPTLLHQLAHTGAPWSNTPGAGKLPDVLLVPLGGGLAGAGALAIAVAGAALGPPAPGRRTPGRGPTRPTGHATGRRPSPPGAVSRRGVPAPRRAIAALLAMAGVAAILAWVVSQVEPGWADRYFAVVAGPLLLAVAAGAARAGTAGLVAALALALAWATDTGREQHGNARELARALGSPSLVISAQPEQVAVLSRYLGAGPRYATALGPTGDPSVMDWRDATARLRDAAPAATVARTLAGARPGDRVALVRPVIAAPRRWRAPWTRLVRLRAAQWGAALDRDPRLRRLRTVSAPLTGGADVWAREWRVRAP